MGGGALSRLHIPSDNMQVASFDESNAFTSVMTPPWFWPWSATPPVRAKDVWKKLSPEQRASVLPETWVAPLY